MKLVNPIPKSSEKKGKPSLDKKKIKKFEIRLDLSPKKLIIWFLIVMFGLSFLSSLFHPGMTTEEINLTQALVDIKENKIQQVLVDQDRLLLTYKDGKKLMARKESGESLVRTFEAAGIDPKSVEVKVVDQTITRAITDVLGTILPLVIMAVFFYYIFRQAKGAQDNIFSFGQSRARLFAKGKQAVTFDDVAGVDEAKKELEEVVDFLKHPQKYRALGARTPKGVLIVGPSGVGKTLLAKAVAGEAGVPFFSMAGSEFMEMLVGVGASRVRDLFSTAKKAAPAIIFIDEIDAIGRQRGSGMFGGGGHDEREQTLNQILVEMDGFTPNDNVLVVAATNRGDLLDPALLRPGRFDRTVVLDMPDLGGRKAILQIHAQGKHFGQNVNWEKVAKRTVGFSGADLENMLNEAAILAARLNKKEIDESDLEEAAVKVKLGPERKRLQSDEDKKMTAYHEAGHAVVSHFSPHTDPVHRISIVARGISLGHTLIAPLKDRSHETKTRLLEQIQVMMGGRAAEELIFNEMTTGAANDLSQGTRIARAMVVDFGMSSLGPIFLGPQMDMDEIGKVWYEPNNISPEMQAKVDSEINRITDFAYKSAQAILLKNRKKLDKIAEKLLERETIEEEEFERLMK